MSKKLASWKKASLSRGGRLTLIEAVLSAMPTYFLSLFKVLMGVAKCMEKIMRNFRCDSTDGEVHCHVVAWEQVGKPKDRGVWVWRIFV